MRHEPTLLGIPPEIRRMILEQLFPPNLHHPYELILNRHGQIEVALEKHEKSVLIALLLTCEKLAQETRHVLFANPLVIVWDDVPVFECTFGPQISAQLRSIDIVSEERGNTFGFVALIKNLASKFPNLEKVNISFKETTRFLAGLFDLTTAICPCTSLFQGPQLKIVVHEIPRHLLETDSYLNELHVIEVSGPLSLEHMEMLERHTCPTGHCFMRLDWAHPTGSVPSSPHWDDQPRSFGYSWRGGCVVPPASEFDYGQYMRSAPTRDFHDYPLVFADNPTPSAKLRRTTEELREHLASFNLNEAIGGPLETLDTDGSASSSAQLPVLPPVSTGVQQGMYTYNVNHTNNNNLAPVLIPTPTHNANGGQQPVQSMVDITPSTFMSDDDDNIGGLMSDEDISHWIASQSTSYNFSSSPSSNS
ncbi:hypothetical protein PV10_01280 [Exophiala mesophila]|uniref:F-box domain-containing protein n=1 Tax=Exophiala mesophila TaxID=212818 RepID=A0A0D1YAC6_EXOME|nr:uncharacterized protein PV10_01280 [Exophiala mesophila]KIV97541.1 hypothetical protein PV10_01280 [Exophiala mesophila]